jgi:hypothetical protein
MKPINFKELANLVDDWRESKFRLDAAEGELSKLTLPPKPAELRGQKQYDEYAKRMEKYDKDFDAISARVNTEQNIAERIRTSIVDIIGETLDTWFVVECKDNAEYGVFAKNHYDTGTKLVIVKSWDKKHPDKKD